MRGYEEPERPCPYCGEGIKRLPDHLPCEGVPRTEGFEV